MRKRDIESDIIYREIVSLAEKNNGVIDEMEVIRILSEDKLISVTPGVVRTRIKYYQENVSNGEKNSS